MGFRKLFTQKLQLIYILLACSLILNSCNRQSASSDMTYTCPMHPDIIKHEASTCPICFMDLVPVHSNADMTVDKDVLALTKPVNETILSDVKTIYPEILTISDTLSLNGTVTYNRNNQQTISSYINGRIEKLYIKYNYQAVNKGQKIMEIYSPDLVNVQQEILYLKTSTDPELLQKAINKFRLLGATQQQVQQLLNSGKVNYRFAIYSKTDGYIVENSQNSPGAANTMNATAPMSDEMGASSASAMPGAITNTPLTLREGMYVNSGQSIFNVYNASGLWAEFYLPASVAPLVNKGDEISIQQQKYRIQNLQPYYKDGQNFTVARIFVSGKDFKIGQLIDGKISPAPIKGLWVPASAVYSTGNKQVVFTLSGGKLVPRNIIVGATLNHKILVKEGLTDNEKIAEQASLLVDSEGFLLTNND